ncbi:seryl-tRNA synthetase [Catalinimonas alkaloidigena]|uniref:Serine--tRNA ligase n=1 Tax=Catalinimonas alkaloidigena TaxID=1075417 RepID=A0A1G9E624_9BACT|nr:serine--tRNA ligase [Catalinimonas alkaloidigena]SDK71569.1 seryl-tRNA synthetase [Catalinimonas alkaloidigena]
MLQVQFIRENQEKVLAGLQKRNFPNAETRVARILDLDTQRRELQGQLDRVLADANQRAKAIGQLMKTGQRDQAEIAKQEAAQLRTRSKELTDQLATAVATLDEWLVELPNVPHESVPAGTSADENEVVREVGEHPHLPTEALPHWDLIRQYNIIDFELGNKISGAGFPVYKGKGARLQRALVNFFLDKAMEAGYVEVQPPILVNRDSGYGTGQLPDKDGQMYHITADDLFVIPTAEVPITNLYRDVILEKDELPVRHVGYTPCFRREAGSWGAHVRGLNRLHQFDKVEIVQVRRPEESYQALEEMLAHVEHLLQQLQLPYRVLRLCGGDMGFTSALTYDLEVWSAAQQRWLEVSSVSNFETFQANRLKLRYRPEAGKKPEILHTLNGSALALPRIVAALLENNQTPEGVRLPDVLHPYTGFASIE